jgi:CHASE2 domain-containing sensor protein
MSKSDDDLRKEQLIKDSSIKDSKVQMGQSESGDIQQIQQNAHIINNHSYIGLPENSTPQDLEDRNQVSSNLKRERLKQQVKALQEEWELTHRKLVQLRRDLTIQAGSSVIFQLEQEIEREELRLQIVEDKLAKIEQNLSDYTELEQKTSGEISDIRSKLLTVRSPEDLQVILYTVQKLFKREPDNSEVKSLMDKIKNAIKPKAQVLTNKPGVQVLNETNDKGKNTRFFNPFKVLNLVFTNKIVTSCLASTFLVSSSIVGLRMLSFFEPIELEAFDTLIQQRQIVSKEEPDSRILVIQATPADIQAQRKEPANKATLSEDTLEQLFDKLRQYEPKVIGLDIYRDFPTNPKLYPHLASALNQKKLFTICKRKSKKDPDGVAPPPDAILDNAGFNDAIDDNDGVLRRHILSMEVPRDPKDVCTATDNLSLQIASNYLLTVNPHLDMGTTLEDDIRIGDIVFKKINSSSGSYQRIDAGGRQILLNYRILRSPLEISQNVTLGDILNDRIPKNRIGELKGKIILIGIAKPVNSSNDYWKTPYRINFFGEKETVPGVFVQAHMISQILSAVQNKRTLLWTWNEIGEISWIVVWSVIGWILGTKLNSRLHLLIAIGLSGILIYGICYCLLLYGGWIPIVPTILALVLSAISRHVSRHKQMKLS